MGTETASTADMSLGKLLTDALKRKGMSMTAPHDEDLTPTKVHELQFLHSALAACPYLTLLTHLYEVFAQCPPALTLLLVFHGISLQRICIPFFPPGGLPFGLAIIDHSRLGLTEAADLSEAFNRATEIWGYVHHSIMIDLGGPHPASLIPPRTTRKEDNSYRNGLGGGSFFGSDVPSATSSPIGKELLASWIKRAPKMSTNHVACAYFNAWRTFVDSIKPETSELGPKGGESRRQLLMDFISGPLSGPPKAGTKVAKFGQKEIEDLLIKLTEEKVVKFIPGEIVAELKSMLIEHGRGNTTTKDPETKATDLSISTEDSTAEVGRPKAVLDCAVSTPDDVAPNQTQTSLDDAIKQVIALFSEDQECFCQIFNSVTPQECTERLELYLEKKAGSSRWNHQANERLRTWARKRWDGKPEGWIPEPISQDIVKRVMESVRDRDKEMQQAHVQAKLRTPPPFSDVTVDSMTAAPSASGSQPVSSASPVLSTPRTPTSGVSPSFTARFAGLFSRTGKASSSPVNEETDFAPREVPDHAFAEQQISFEGKKKGKVRGRSGEAGGKVLEKSAKPAKPNAAHQEAGSLDRDAVNPVSENGHQDDEVRERRERTALAREACQWLCRRLYATKLFDPKAFNCEQPWMSTSSKQLLLAAMDRSVPLLLAVLAATSGDSKEKIMDDEDSVLSLPDHGLRWKDKSGVTVDNEWRRWPSPTAPVIAPKDGQTRKLSLRDRWPNGPGKQNSGFTSSKHIRAQDLSSMPPEVFKEMDARPMQVFRCLYPVPLEYSQASLQGKALQEAVFIGFEHQLTSTMPRMTQILQLSSEDKDIEYRVLKIDLPTSYGLDVTMDLLSDYPVDYAPSATAEEIVASPLAHKPLYASDYHHLALTRQIVCQYRDQLPRKGREWSGKMLEDKPPLTVSTYDAFDLAVLAESRKRKLEDVSSRPPATREDLSAAIKAKQQKRMKKSHR